MDKFAVLTILVVALAVASVNAHPSPQTVENSGDTAETTTATSGVRGWLKNVQNKFRDHGHDCNHGPGGRGGGVLNWVKNKFGYGKTTTAVPTTASTETSVSNEHRPETVDHSGEEDITPSVDGGRPAATDGDSSSEGQWPAGAENEKPVTENQNETSGEEPSPPETENVGSGVNSGEDLRPSNAEEVTSSTDPLIDRRIQL